MDNFGEYMTKKRSELFFFIKDFTLAVLRFSDRHGYGRRGQDA